MKNKSIISILLLGMGLGCGFSSCEDMLTTNSDRKVYIPAQDTLYTYWGIQKCLQNIAERQVILGEVRGDLVATTSKVTDSIYAIANFENPQDGDCRYLEVKDYYAVINNCNNYLANADTMATSTGQKIMIKEYAQVSAIRAWTYLQLVNNYKEVPYYTEPLTSLEFVNNFDFSKEKNKINKDNIAEKLIPTLEKFVDTPYPSYGSYNNGAVDIHSELTMMPVRLVMGDIYLTSAKTQEDYAKAAQCYYDYLKATKGYLPSYNSNVGKMTTVVDGNSSERYIYNLNTSQFVQTDKPSTTNEVITVIPSAGNKLYGNILTGVCNVFGWSTSSRISTTGGDENSTEDTETSTSASVSVSLNPEMKEVTGSNQFWTLCKAQSYVVFDEQLNEAEYYEGAGDARQGALDEIVGDYGYFVIKQCPDYSFSYTYPVIYRKSLVWLRFAEAINRAGFPSYAFAILKDGLCREYLPVYTTVQVPDKSQPGTENEETGEIEYPMKDSTYYDTQNKNCYYINESEFKLAQNTPYLEFTTEFTNGSGEDINVIGVHSKGCGDIDGLKDTIYTYKRMVNAKLPKKDSYVQEDTITAVEELIVDELALETAFEGNRFTDLLRVANRRANGAEWLADKIARRGDTGDVNVDYTQTQEYQTLYNKLLDTKNWYFELPAYK